MVVEDDMKNQGLIDVFRNSSERSKIELIFRYISLVITSYFYITNNFNYYYINKLIIILCISVSSIILSYLYVKNKESQAKIKVLILVETIGNSFILIVSGGFESPYIWYVLNTILIVSIELNIKYGWINWMVYIAFSSIFGTFLIDEPFSELIVRARDDFKFIVSLIMITLGFQLLAKYIKNLEKEKQILKDKNEELMIANNKINDSMQYIMALYQTVHSFSNKRNISELLKLLVYYAMQISKSKLVFFDSVIEKNHELYIDDSNQNNALLKKRIMKELAVSSEIIYTSTGPVQKVINGKKMLMIAVKSNYMLYGILGIESDFSSNNNSRWDNFGELNFIAELSAIVLEKVHLEEVNYGLIINEEQNRIANEIHDNVLQKLFSMSSAIYTLSKKLEKITIDQIKEELDFIRQSTDKAMKDLRYTIYGLSWNKQGKNAFETDITDYLNELEKLNNVAVTCRIIGNHMMLPYRQKKAIYRIICEGTGNAVRHGKAKNIQIEIDIKLENCQLKIKDDGIGFNLEKTVVDKNLGLGIKNLYFLAESLNGQLDIESEEGKGTTILSIIPNHY